MFKFGFSLNEGDVSVQTKANSSGDDDDNASGGLEWLPSTEILLDNCSEMKLPLEWEVLHINQCVLYHIRPSEISHFIESNENLRSADIIPAKYEGGLKIWDCTNHLIHYLTQKRPTCQIEFKDKVVLDLGCGNGLLGITAFILGASSVHFQDYNEDVIKIATIPSVLKNLRSSDNCGKLCKYFCGDWMSFSKLIKDTYDIVLTSATIYNTSNYNKLLSVFKNGLKRDGVIFVAAKTYYFGNGGGTRQFEEALAKDGTFNSEVLWTSTEGVQQEILKVTYKNRS